jgi:hypothetical protein
MYNFALAKNIQISQAFKKVRNVLIKSTNKVREVQKNE